MSSILSTARGALLVTFFKWRWLTDVRDLLEDTLSRDDGLLAFDDIDMDNDLRELKRVSGPEALAELALEVFEASELPSGLAAEALAPELEGASGLCFLRLLAVNVAFRLRTPSLLEALTQFTVSGSAPRLDPRCLGALLGRALLRREAEAQLEGAGLEPEALLRALEAARGIAEVDLGGSRLHVQAEPEPFEQALDRVMRPRERAGWTQGVGSPARRRLLAHKQRAGWFTLLEEGDSPSPELAQKLAACGGVKRVAWVRAQEAELDLRVYQGTRLVLDRAGLMARAGGELSSRDVSAVLRSLGVLDLDPEHARGVPLLRWARAAGLDFKKKSIRSFCYL